jgi:4-amino-4-deoxy-L-arabinose transferase-like glycosyltransferase
MHAFSYFKESAITPAKAWLLALLCFAWLATGLIGHDPWKPDEAYSFGLVYHILQSGDWLVPTLAGETFLDKPPFFYMTAAVFAKLFAPILPLHDGARLASGFFMGLTLIFTGFSGRELFGKDKGWSAAIVLIGCLGLLINAHLLSTDLGLLAGSAVMLYGYALNMRRPLLAGLLLGTGLGIGFMTKGFIAPVIFVSISILLFAFKAWRTRNYLLCLAIALISALPWLAIWPILLYQRSPELFMEWAWQNNIENWLYFAKTVSTASFVFYIKILSWFAWPALPIAIWAVWDARKKILQQREGQLLLVTFLVMLCSLSLVPYSEEVFAMPMLLPIVLLATMALPTLRRGAANALDSFGNITFGFVAILLWWSWYGLIIGNNTRVSRWFKAYQSEYLPTFDLVTFSIALAVTIIWLLLVWRIGRSIRRSVINWAAGVTLLWVLLMTLWLPWLDFNKSYRTMVTSLAAALPEKHNCIASRYLGDAQKAMLHYVGNILTIPGGELNCDLLLTQGNLSRSDQRQGDWKTIWKGGRRGQQGDRYYLYQRQPVAVKDEPQAAEPEKTPDNKTEPAATPASPESAG